MNVSMQDTYNLGWKIAHCVQGKAPRSILKTYQSERRRIAQDLIAFDHKFSRLFSGRPAKDAADEAGVSMEEFKRVFLQGAMFASGLSVDYGRSMLVAKPGDSKDQGDGTDVDGRSASSTKAIVVGKQDLAKNCPLGMRFPSFQVVNQSGGKPWPFQQWLKSDGRYRVILFAGDVRDKPQSARLTEWCSQAMQPRSWLMSHTSSTQDLDSVIEIFTIHSAPRTEVELLDHFPELLRPLRKGGMGYDYNKVFADDESYHHGHGHAYLGYGVDASRGAVVVVRPDGYTGWIGELEDVHGLESYFGGCLLEV